MKKESVRKQEARDKMKTRGMQAGAAAAAGAAVAGTAFAATAVSSDNVVESTPEDDVQAQANAAEAHQPNPSSSSANQHTQNAAAASAQAPQTQAQTQQGDIASTISQHVGGNQTVNPASPESEVLPGPSDAAPAPGSTVDDSAIVTDVEVDDVEDVPGVDNFAEPASASGAISAQYTADVAIISEDGASDSIYIEIDNICGCPNYGDEASIVGQDMDDLGPEIDDTITIDL